MTSQGLIFLAVSAAFGAGTLAVALYRICAPLLSPSRCPTCRGLGSARLLHEAGLRIRHACPDCAGTGTLAAVVPDRLPADW